MASVTDLRRRLENAINFADGVVTLETEHDGIAFEDHRNIVTSSSTYFQRRFAATTTRLVSIPTSEMCFNIYVNWLYTGVLCVIYTDSKPIADTAEYCLLVEMHSLGISLEDEVFTSLISEAFLAKMRGAGSIELPEWACINAIIELNTAPVGKTHAVKLIAEAYAKHASRRDLEGLLKGSVLESFWQEVALQMGECRARPRAEIGSDDVCRFHEHEPDEECEVEFVSKKRRRIE